MNFFSQDGAVLQQPVTEATLWQMYKDESDPDHALPKVAVKVVNGQELNEHRDQVIGWQFADAYVPYSTCTHIFYWHEFFGHLWWGSICLAQHSEAFQHSDDIHLWLLTLGGGPPSTTHEDVGRYKLVANPSFHKDLHEALCGIKDAVAGHHSEPYVNEVLFQVFNNDCAL